MAQNYRQPGEVLTMTAPTGGLKSGDGCLFGALFGVAQFDALQTEEVEVATEGVWTLAKPNSVISFAEGALVYWDLSEAECTSTAATNYLIGVAARAAGATEASVDVRLNGISTVAEAGGG